ncbi:MAG TPA: FAD binding domain-containing protein [Burkholderiales bacterium]|nr:FAD binding domain-containing protein [Burkholderiales bacterium]
MKPVAFDYLRADSADEAVAALAQHGEEARVLAGGQSLMAILNMRLAAPKVLVDIHRAADLSGISVRGGHVRVQAAATQAALQRHPELDRWLPLVAQALPHVGHFQIRNRGTVCGSIAHADPSAELPLCLATLGGEVVLRSRRGRRTVAAQDFFTGMLQTARMADELVEEARFPVTAAGERHGFIELSMRHGDFAIVALAAVVGHNGIRLGVGGVADRPQVVRWPRLAGKALDEALNQLAWDLGAQDDIHATAVYRRHLVRTLGRQLIERLSAP